MVVSVLNSVVMPILRFCVDLFFRVVNSLDARGFIFGAFIVITITRFLLLPLIGGKAIDMATKVGSDIRAKREEKSSNSADESK